ncbi:MAG: HEAT repeat domain-containing protein [Gammaproteobacteria bacterium]
MIESAEEFVRLRESVIPEEYHKAANEKASLEVWNDVLEKYPEMAFWVAQNKSVPIQILEKLAKHSDPKVRDMVARKRKIPESLMLVLANDCDSSVRNALVNNGKVTERVLHLLVKDSWKAISKRAAEKLQALTKLSN